MCVLETSGIAFRHAFLIAWKNQLREGSTLRFICAPFLFLGDRDDDTPRAGSSFYRSTKLLIHAGFVVLCCSYASVPNTGLALRRSTQKIPAEIYHA